MSNDRKRLEPERVFALAKEMAAAMAAAASAVVEQHDLDKREHGPLFAAAVAYLQLAMDKALHEKRDEQARNN